ncbi:MAG: glycosyltransferase family 39 protein [Deltaproteobacteria bacterium]|nr:glycosyltransferase family 39 protein [Deltaproteobacteria bacterium]
MWKLFSDKAALPGADNECQRWFWISFIAFSLLHFYLILFSPLGLAPDEAQYWDWSRSLDWAYFSKGPVVAFLIYLSCQIFGDTIFAVRLPALLLFSIFSWLFHSFVKKNYGAYAALIAFLILRTLPIFMVQAFAMTTDTPVALFWLLALIYFHSATIKGRALAWLPGFFFLGLAVLSKYTAMIMLPMIVAYCLFSGSLRNQLKNRFFLLGMVILLTLIAPLLYWNMAHGWVNVAHNAGHLIPSDGFGLQIKFVFELLGGQLGLFNPILFVLFLSFFWRAFNKWRDGDNEVGFYFCFSYPLLALCLFVSLSRRVYANWPMPAYIAALLLIIYLVSKDNFHIDKTVRITKWVLGWNCFFYSLILVFSAGVTLGLPGNIIPTKNLMGWKNLAEKVSTISLPTAGGAKPMIITDHYGYTAELSFFLEDKPIAFCAPVSTRRATQYDVWGKDEEHGFKYRNFSSQIGRDALIVIKEEGNIAEFHQWFKEIKPISGVDEFIYIFGGKSIRTADFYYGTYFLGVHNTPNPPIPIPK